jgi:hypothetical protein
MRQQTILPFEVVQTDAPLTAQRGLILPYEMAKALRIPEVIDRELPSPGSGRGYKPSQFIMPLIMMLHGGGKKLDDLRELKGEASLRELLEMKGLPASCTVGDWLRRMGERWQGSFWLRQVESACGR